jgi:RNA-directed DNA polymerase
MIHILIGSAWRPKWIMDADIKGFFDNISHEWLLSHIPMNKAILNQWLKAGALDMVKGESLESSAGVPQGGPISPIITNMA